MATISDHRTHWCNCRMRDGECSHCGHDTELHNHALYVAGLCIRCLAYLMEHGKFDNCDHVPPAAPGEPREK